jgi:hypothetical protein
MATRELLYESLLLLGYHAAAVRTIEAAYQSRYHGSVLSPSQATPFF